jgi:hypothetical protein
MMMLFYLVGQDGILRRVGNPPGVCPMIEHDHAVSAPGSLDFSIFRQDE